MRSVNECHEKTPRLTVAINVACNKKGS